jgi:hypothetical protein
MPRIDGVKLKIERAKEHIIEFDRRLRIFADDKPYEIGAKPHKIPEIDHVTLYIKSVKDVPPELSTVIGDTVHNLRSALDHLAWQLVEAGGGIPNKDTYFPIVPFGPQSAQKYASAIGKGEIHKMPVGADKVLLEEQPYTSGDDTLWHIHELDRFDKHRFLITTGTAYGNWSVMVGNQPLVFRDWAKIPLVAGYEIVNIPRDTYERTPHENFKLGIDVSFGQSEIVPGWPVLETLNHMTEFVDFAVSRFEPFLI